MNNTGKKKKSEHKQEATLLISLIPLCNRFAELYGGGQAQDRVRNQVMPNVGPELDTLG